MKLPATIFALLALCSCATYGPSIPTPEELNLAANAAFAGKPVEAMVGRYGFPQEEKTFNGRHYYVWHTSNSMTWRGPSRSVTTTGSIGDPSQYPYTPSVPYRETTEIPTQQTETYVCSMAAEVTPAPVIQVSAVRFTGKMGACQSFMP